MFPLAIFIGGPTASGKSKLAIDIQSKVSSFIVNADSMQVYDKLDILTNKPNKKELKNSDCKLFSFLKYPEKCNVGLWRKKSIELLNNIKKTPIFVGGTGLYLESLINDISEIPKYPIKLSYKLRNFFKKRDKVFFMKNF